MAGKPSSTPTGDALQGTSDERKLSTTPSASDGRGRLRAAPLILAAIGITIALWAVAAGHAAQSGDDPSEIRTLLPVETGEEQIALPELPPLPTGDSLDRTLDLETQRPHRPRVGVARYTVQPGDSVFGIAAKFGLKPETVLWGNFEVLADDPHSLRPGQELNMLPVDGTYYQWQAGDDLTAVADFFGVEPEVILDWPGNDLGFDSSSIQVGSWLIVPGGARPFQTWHVPTIPRGRAGVGAASGSGACEGDYSGGAVGTGGFIWPTANHMLSGNDYWSGHLAIDIAAGYGESIWAADSGVVVFAGWSYGGYGQLVMLDHGNGWQTIYAHLSQINVACGADVLQGQRIGLAGSTGNSTGPHLHFETRFEDGFVNPWFVLP